MSFLKLLFGNGEIISLIGKILSIVTIVIMTGTSHRIQMMLQSKNKKQEKTLSHKENIEEETVHTLKVAWLLTFPNSGTSYVTKLISSATNTVTATNYGDEYSTTKESLLVQSDWKDGPFLSSNELDLPDKFLLTKSHCGGWFFNTSPEFYLFETLDLFEEHCLSGTKIIRENENENNVLVKDITQYGFQQVYKAIHLIRNPFDNLVARFHHEYVNALMKNRRKKKSFNYSYNAHGFQAWCHDIDTRFQQAERKLYPSQIREFAEQVPCHAELYRYIIWHNNAFALGEKHIKSGRLPIHILKYEDFRSNYLPAIHDLFEFLELEGTSRPMPFTYGDNIHYFTMPQRDYIKEFIKLLASDTTWLHINHYFETESIKNTPYAAY